MPQTSTPSLRMARRTIGRSPLCVPNREPVPIISCPSHQERHDDPAPKSVGWNRGLHSGTALAIEFAPQRWLDQASAILNRMADAREASGASEGVYKLGQNRFVWRGGWLGLAKTIRDSIAPAPPSEPAFYAHQSSMQPPEPSRP